MNYWLLCLPRVDMIHCINTGVFGATKKGSLDSAKKGDKLICYVTKDCKFIASGELTSDYYMSDEIVFLSEGVYPDRFNFKATQVPIHKEVDAKNIVNDLEFITNKLYWSVFFRLSNRKINKKDYDLIIQKMR